MGAWHLARSQAAQRHAQRSLACFVRATQLLDVWTEDSAEAGPMLLDTLAVSKLACL